MDTSSVERERTEETLAGKRRFRKAAWPEGDRWELRNSVQGREKGLVLKKKSF